MFEIKNISDEILVIETKIDTTVLGCRLIDSPPEPRQLLTGEVLCFLGYEPGVSLIISPLVDSDKARVSAEFVQEYTHVYS